MLQAICCATMSETSERMCRTADKWKLQARMTVEMCLLKLMVWSSITPRSFKLSLTATQLSATRRCAGCGARAWRRAVTMMMASDLLPLSSRWLRQEPVLETADAAREPVQRASATGDEPPCGMMPTNQTCWWWSSTTTRLH